MEMLSLNVHSSTDNMFVLKMAAVVSHFKMCLTCCSEVYNKNVVSLLTFTSVYLQRCDSLCFEKHGVFTLVTSLARFKTISKYTFSVSDFLA